MRFRGRCAYVARSSAQIARSRMFKLISGESIFAVLEPPDRVVYSPEAARQFIGPFATACNVPPVLSRCISIVHERSTMKMLSKVSAMINNS